MYYDGRDYNDNGCLDSVTDRVARAQEKKSSQEEIYSTKQPIVFCEHPIQAINPVTDYDNPFKIEKIFQDYKKFVMEFYGFPYKAQKA